MAVGGLTQGAFVGPDGLGDARQRGVQRDRLAVPPVDDVPEARCRGAARTEGGTLLILAMNACSMARMSSLRTSIFPATEVITSKSVPSDVTIGSFRRCLAGYKVSTQQKALRFHLFQNRAYAERTAASHAACTVSGRCGALWHPMAMRTALSISTIHRTWRCPRSSR